MIRVTPYLVTAILLAGSPPAAAQTTQDPGTDQPLELPAGATETSREIRDPGQYLMPLARHTPQAQPAETLSGRVTLTSYRLPAERADTVAVLQAIRDQLRSRGWNILFECQTETCGGFDFRFALEVVPPPAMEVDLRDFTFLSARRTAAPQTSLTALISRSPRGGFVQMVEVAPSRTAPLALAPPSRTDLSAPTGDPGPALLEQGRVVLENVRFPSGAREMDESAVAALAPLAEFLDANPDIAILVVGHTDNTGSLDGNITVSRARARAVRDALVGRYGISTDRISAEGAGFLSPRAPNTTEEGRALNRRVEIVLR